MRHMSNQYKAVFLLMGLLCAFQAQAGRPLTVDDANVNEVGEGHVEGWWTRAPDGSRSWTVAPAYAPMKNLELGAGIAREQKTGLETTNVQAKFRLTEAQDNGCNWGAVLGTARTSGESSKGYVNALFTCNHATLGSLHTNLGALDFQAVNASAPGAWLGNAHSVKSPRMWKLTDKSTTSPPGPLACAPTSCPSCNWMPAWVARPVKTW